MNENNKIPAIASNKILLILNMTDKYPPNPIATEDVPMIEEKIIMINTKKPKNLLKALRA